MSQDGRKAGDNWTRLYSSVLNQNLVFAYKNATTTTVTPQNEGLHSVLSTVAGGVFALAARGRARMTDIVCAMTTSLLPAAFAFIEDDRNSAVDAALVETLPSLEGHAQEAALTMLIKRAHTPALAALAAGYDGYGDQLRRLILARASGLLPGIRAAISSASFKERACAIKIIVQGNASGAAYLLADALRVRCRRTRELAAAGLHRMTAKLVDRLACPHAEKASELNSLSAGLLEALSLAVRRWELHFRPEILQAALWMGDRLEPVILEKARERRSRVVKALCDQLEGTTDVRLAGSVVRALGVPELAQAAARAISRSRDAAFVRSLLSESWLLADSRVERGCRRLRNGRWLPVAMDALLTLEPAAVESAVRFLMSTGGPPASKLELFKKLAGAGHEHIRHAVTWQLFHDESDAATEVLTLIAARPVDGIAVMAEREVRRRRGGLVCSAYKSARSQQQGRSCRETFERFWEDFDVLGSGQRAEAADALRRHANDVGVCLRSRLASTEPLDRMRALRVVHTLRMVERMRESIHRLANDQNTIVRSLAVSLLGSLPDPTTVRVLRTAINDPDERVQANAIEALDRLGVSERIPLTAPKLESRDGRVRANAVRSLLRAERHEAGETLLAMLGDTSRGHRLSALWVVDRLRLRAVRDRVHAISRGDLDEQVRKRAGRVLANLADNRPGRMCRPVAPDRLRGPLVANGRNS